MADALGNLLAQLQASKPEARVLILDLPRDTLLRQVHCGPAAGLPSPTVELTIVVASVDFVALQEIADRLGQTAQAQAAAAKAGA